MKKLEDISFTKTQLAWYVTRFSGKDVLLHADFNPFPKFHPFSRIPAFPGWFTPSNLMFAKDVFDTATTPDMPMEIRLNKTGMHFINDYYGDTAVILGGFFRLRDYPDAQKMLWHYLTGKAEEVEVDTDRVLREDEKLKKFIFNSIMARMKEGKTKGSVNITQGIYGNPNWHAAFGSINVKWIAEDSLVQLWIEDLYDWHPNEPRPTQAVHRVMANAQAYGARPFKYHGTIYKTRIYVN